jgi:maltooligosyltrehalose trehalohydrolase
MISLKPFGFARFIWSNSVPNRESTEMPVLFRSAPALQEGILMARIAGTTLGANYLGEGRCRFVVWAPYAQQVEVHLYLPEERSIALAPAARGYFEAIVAGVEPGARYKYRLDGDKELPDPASRYQPEGVHGPSEVIDPVFVWDDARWPGLPLREYIIYELHVGTFTSGGTFESAIEMLPYLKDLGVTAIELMPIAQFPGRRNWGYDGVYPFAAQNSYGGPKGLKKLVNASHQIGLAVVLDVVYNHLGPEGNYFSQFGPYFTSRHRTPWGDAINFDGVHSDEVRGYFINSALYWITECHIDALRLDAVHAILDNSATPFLEVLARRVALRSERLRRAVQLIAESALNDVRLIRRPEKGGFGLSAQWNDDFHHVLRVLLTGDRSGYYADFGGIEQLAKAYREGYVLSGQYSEYRQRRFGSDSARNPAEQFVVFAQNHDHIGNRMLGERLTALVSFESAKLAAGAFILSPYLPLLFMGEEYAEDAPFLYFIEHGDPQLVEAVRRGRREEFSGFHWLGEPPDPQSEETFRTSQLRHETREQGQHGVMLAFYRELLRLRRTIAALSHLCKHHMEVSAFPEQQVLVVRREAEESQALLICNFREESDAVTLSSLPGEWSKVMDSSDTCWNGSGPQAPEILPAPPQPPSQVQPLAHRRSHRISLPPRSFALYQLKVAE